MAVAVIVGIGPGNGTSLARRFAAEGYAVALLSRNLENLHALAAALPGARAYACDAGDPASIEAALAGVRRDLGEVEVLVWNAGSGAWGNVEQVTLEGFEQSWRVNTLGAFAASKLCIPAMKARGGSIVFIGATSSVKGGARTAGFSSAKFAQRGLAQSMARHLWPQGIHVCLVVVDGVIDLPRTRAQMADRPDSFFIQPDGIAATVMALVKQERSAWSFEVEARPYQESW